MNWINCFISILGISGTIYNNFSMSLFVSGLATFIQCKKIEYPIQIFMNEGFNSVITEYMGGIILEVDYNPKKYNSEIEVMEDFLNFLNGPKTETDEFGIYPVKS